MTQPKPLTRQVNIRLAPGLLRAVRAECRRQGIGMSEITRDLLTTWLEVEKAGRPSPPPPAP